MSYTVAKRGDPGPQGVSATSFRDMWAVGTSDTVAPQTGWSTERPDEIGVDEWLWRRVDTMWSNSSQWSLGTPVVDRVATGVWRTVTRIDQTSTAITLEVESARGGYADLSHAVDAAAGLTYDYAFERDETAGHTAFTATLHRGAEDITGEVDPDRFVWLLRDETGTSVYARGPACAVPDSLADYRTTVVGGYDPDGTYERRALASHGGRRLKTAAGAPLAAKTIEEG
ncbi:MAG: hypothetical protein Q3963_06740 [Coriobacteriaceae bacterium]|nr:hypothetical protein [Coriobacteriaceae bacterium]